MVAVVVVPPLAVAAPPVRVRRALLAVARQALPAAHPGQTEAAVGDLVVAARPPLAPLALAAHRVPRARAELRPVGARVVRRGRRSLLLRLG